MGNDRLVTQAELAKARGVSRQYVAKLLKQGVLKSQGPRKLIDLAEANRTLDEMARPSRERMQKKHNPVAGKPALPEQDEHDDTGEPHEDDDDKGDHWFKTFKKAEAREKLAKAELAELELARKRGEMGLVSEFENAAFELSKRFGQELEGILRIEHQLGAARTKHERTQILKAEVKRIRTSLMLPAEPETIKKKAAKKKAKKKGDKRK